jgi:hypothetical protein
VNTPHATCSTECLCSGLFRFLPLFLPKIRFQEEHLELDSNGRCLICHAVFLQDVGLRELTSKRQMKIMMRWMRERQKLRLICDHDGPHKQFLYTTWFTNPKNTPPRPKSERSPEGSPTPTSPYQAMKTEKIRGYQMQCSIVVCPSPHPCLFVHNIVQYILFVFKNLFSDKNIIENNIRVREKHQNIIQYILFVFKNLFSDENIIENNTCV